MSSTARSPSSPAATAASARPSCWRWPSRAPTIVIDYVANPDATEELEQQIVALGDTGHRRRGRRQQGRRPPAAGRRRRQGVRPARHHGQQRRHRDPHRRSSTPPRQQYEKVLDINLKSAFFGTQIAAKQMIAQGDGGRIINITSVHEDWPMPGNTPYCLSKGGMRMLTRTAGVELAPARHPRRRRRPGRGGHADQRVDRGRPGEDEDARRRHPDRPHGAARGDRQRRRLPRRRRRELPRRPPRSSPTAGSCTRAPGSDPGRSPNGRDARRQRLRTNQTPSIRTRTPRTIHIGQEPKTSRLSVRCSYARFSGEPTFGRWCAGLRALLPLLPIAATLLGLEGSGPGGHPWAISDRR